MIKHIVCFKLKDGEDVNKAKEILLSMKDNVPMLKDIQVGVDILHSERSYDLYLSVVVDDMKALEEYQNHPYHVDVVKTHMHKVRTASVAVDFEI
ncbi:MAG: Dabb family protein [Clostridiales bacterium]|nr:Dabb family protein [Clostridiales bacterium]